MDRTLLKKIKLNACMVWAYFFLLDDSTRVAVEKNANIPIYRITGRKHRKISNMKGIFRKIFAS